MIREFFFDQDRAPAVSFLFRQFVPPFEDVKSKNISNTDAVKISTLHSAKRLEFRIVIIINSQSKLLFEKDEDNVLK